MDALPPKVYAIVAAIVTLPIIIVCACAWALRCLCSCPARALSRVGAEMEAEEESPFLATPSSSSVAAGKARSSRSIHRWQGEAAGIQADEDEAAAFVTL